MYYIKITIYFIQYFILGNNNVILKKNKVIFFLIDTISS